MPQPDSPTHAALASAPHYLVELYTPNAAWQALPLAECQRFVDGIRTGMAPWRARALSC